MIDEALIDLPGGEAELRDVIRAAMDCVLSTKQAADLAACFARAKHRQFRTPLANENFNAALTAGIDGGLSADDAIRFAARAQLYLGRRQEAAAAGSPDAPSAEPPTDERVLRLDAEEFDRVTETLDNPSPPNAALRDLLRRPAPWEEGDDLPVQVRLRCVEWLLNCEPFTHRDPGMTEFLRTAAKLADFVLTGTVPRPAEPPAQAQER